MAFSWQMTSVRLSNATAKAEFRLQVLLVLKMEPTSVQAVQTECSTMALSVVRMCVLAKVALKARVLIASRTGKNSALHATRASTNPATNVCKRRASALTAKKRLYLLVQRMGLSSASAVMMAFTCDSIQRIRLTHANSRYAIVTTELVQKEKNVLDMETQSVQTVTQESTSTIKPKIARPISVIVTMVLGRLVKLALHRELSSAHRVMPATTKLELSVRKTYANAAPAELQQRVWRA